MYSQLLLIALIHFSLGQIIFSQERRVTENTEIGQHPNAVGLARWNGISNFSCNSNNSLEQSLAGRGATQNGNWLQLRNFDFSLPSDAEILSVEVIFSREAFGTVQDTEIALLVGNIKITTPPAAGLWSQGRHQRTYPQDGEDLLWATQWTPSAINSPNFGATLRLKSGNEDGRALLYCVTMKITFSAGSTQCDQDPAGESCSLTFDSPINVDGDFSIENNVKQLQIRNVDLNSEIAPLTVQGCLVLLGNSTQLVVRLPEVPRESVRLPIASYNCREGEFQGITIVSDSQDDSCHTFTATGEFEEESSHRSGRYYVLVGVVPSSTCQNALQNSNEGVGSSLNLLALSLGTLGAVVLATGTILLIYTVLRMRRLKRSRGRLSVLHHESAWMPPPKLTELP